MNFLSVDQLQKVVGTISNAVPCAKCGAKLGHQDISVVGTKYDKCMVMAKCQSCGCPMAIDVNISRKNQKLDGNIHIPTQAIDGITAPQKQYAQQCIEKASPGKEMREALENFDGDFISAFEEN